MKAGRELDALIAEKVMGLESIELTDPKVAGYKFPDDVWPHIPEYSTDIADAWLVVQKLNLFQWFSLAKNGEADWAVWDSDQCTISIADAAPLAICLAALKAVESR